ncbi:MAG: hypothetical protein Q8908_04970, partial [Bacteroidota bacterium]|nr:hypothetical protein [Bacteroidota bacterium]
MEIIRTFRTLALMIGLIAVSISAKGTKYYSIVTGTGNWNSNSTWSNTSGGPAATSCPVAGDDVTIEGGHNVIVTANAACASLTFTTASATTLTISFTFTLNVSGAITIPRSGSGSNILAVGAGKLTAGSIAFTSGGGGVRHQITISTGTVTVTGDVTQVNSTGSATFAFSGAGTLILGGAFLTKSTGTLTLSAGCTVIYNASGNQTVGNFIYNNLTLSGSGVNNTKITTGVTVNEVLSMERTATASVAPTYGSNATLQYNTSIARSPGVEWINPFVASGGVVIDSIGIITLNGAETLNATAPLTIKSGAKLSLSSNTLTLNGNLNNNGTFDGSSGLLRIGTSNVNLGAFLVGTGTVEYFLNGAQSCCPYTYNNLTLSGSGLKTTTGVTVNGILSMEGNATAIASTAPTFGSNATLQYNTTYALTSGAEWPSTFSGSGGVIIKNSGAITMNAAKVLDINVPLTVNSGSTLNTVNNQLTFGGNFINNGTFNAGSSPVIITNTASSQSIAGFTTTGIVSMTKSSGTATFTGNVNGNGLTINGSGGTLNLGTSLTHTFTGNWTSTAGTLDGGSSKLRIGGSVSGSGGTFTASTGTVEWYASALQTCAGVTYNNLTLSGSGSKTTTGVTVNGILSMEGTATASAAPTYGTSATLQYNTSTARNAGPEWTSTFSATGGVIIINSGAITMNAAKVLDINVPLTVNSGSTLKTGNYQLTFGGDFINNGTFNAGTSSVIITNTASSQSIAGFTTTGSVSMTKTGGTATFTGNVNGNGLILNGSGGTLNLGTSLTHTFTGNWTSTAGTLDGGSSKLRIGGSVSGSGGT